MTRSELEQRFAVPGVLAFAESESGMVSARITSPAAQAIVYLQGAHLTDWTPTGHKPVLFLSKRTDLKPGKAIRGGVPVIFPWFGPRQDGKPGPSHGFARTAEWDLVFAAVAGDDVHLTFTLAPNEASRALGFSRFRLIYRMTIGTTLSLELTSATDGAQPLPIEEALHTYFAVADVERTTLAGLGETEYLDKPDHMRRKMEPQGAMSFTATTDRVYVNTTSTCVIEDEAGERRITVAKTGSRSTVVWNPWAEVAGTLPDMEPGAWRGMLCVETANIGENVVLLRQGEPHAMGISISVERSV